MNTTPWTELQKVKIGLWSGDMPGVGGKGGIHQLNFHFYGVVMFNFSKKAIFGCCQGWGGGEDAVKKSLFLHLHIPPCWTPLFPFLEFKHFFDVFQLVWVWAWVLAHCPEHQWFCPNIRVKKRLPHPKKRAIKKCFHNLVVFFSFFSFLLCNWKINMTTTSINCKIYFIQVRTYSICHHQ